MAQALPQHLRKYVVQQNYDKYTPVDQACWRFVMRQLKAFLSTHAHECYLEGLKKTGIEIEKIPRIDDISKKLEQFGWRALPVSGFIPPAAFMELQSLSVLPIASDMRAISHLMYTPAPDIVHEAAGHAPILVDPEFAQYLKEYAQVAKKAIISDEDLRVYEAIRRLSDVKENPNSTDKDVAQAQQNLDQVISQTSHASEATELSRMNWWTAEYGLIGDLKNPKIFGAGLLSSVGESKWCLSDKVKKIPLTLDCIHMSYDITEPQPQLFVAKDFQTLTKVLHELADTMAFRQGGLEGIKKAIRAKTVNTVQLDSGIQISGQCTEVLTNSENNKPIYLKFQGPVQLSYQDQELPGQGSKYHSQGYGTAIGPLKSHSTQQLQALVDTKVRLEYLSGVVVEGVLKSVLEKQNHLLLLGFDQCTVQYQNQVLFEPAWGTYDLAMGLEVTSVFGGPADRASYGDLDDFVAARVPEPKYTTEQLQKFSLYQKVRDLRDQKIQGIQLESELQSVLNAADKDFSKDWLLRLESYELILARAPDSELKNQLSERLSTLSKELGPEGMLIADGLSLADQL